MKAVALLSSGIDSPVAVYMIARKGVDVDCIHMDLSGSRQGKGIEKVRKLRDAISEAAGAEIRVHVGDNRRFHEVSWEKTEKRFHCILCKRFMYRVASGYGRKNGADCLITGESLGQVASQTLDNIFLLSKAASIDLARPLIGFDKQDTIEVAKEIGTYDISAVQTGSCPFVPRKPATRADEEKINKLEESIDTGAFVKECIDSLEELR